MVIYPAPPAFILYNGIYCAGYTSSSARDFLYPSRAVSATPRARMATVNGGQHRVMQVGTGGLVATAGGLTPPEIAKPIWVPSARPVTRTRVGEHLRVEGGPRRSPWSTAHRALSTP